VAVCVLVIVCAGVMRAVDPDRKFNRASVTRKLTATFDQSGIEWACSHAVRI
jgi:hypothetical protein